MRTYRKEKVISVQEYLEKAVCDICGREALGLALEGLSWKYDSGNLNEVCIEIIIRQKEGCSYPDGGSGTSLTVDLCPECFKLRLIPWLRLQGAIIEEEEWDW